MSWPSAFGEAIQQALYNVEQRRLAEERWRNDVHDFALHLVEHPNWTNLMRLTEIVRSKDKYVP